jgi:hypothetical protein
MMEAITMMKEATTAEILLPHQNLNRLSKATRAVVPAITVTRQSIATAMVNRKEKGRLIR